MRTLFIVVVVVGLAAGSFLYGFASHMMHIPPYRQLVMGEQALRDNPTTAKLMALATGGTSTTPGVWAATPNRRSDDGLSSDELKELVALGYVGATEEATGESGVAIYDVSRAYDGLNLYNSGHSAFAALIDMKGRVLHEWGLPFDTAFPDVTPPPSALGQHSWRRVHLLPGGDLLAIYEGLGIVRVDRNSNLVWARANGAHHDIHLEGDRIYVLTRETHLVPEVHSWRNVVEDAITVMTLDGTTIETHSMIDAVLDSQFAPLMEAVDDGGGDIFHTNTIEILDGRHAHLSPHFREGNALISMRALNFVGIVDLTQNQVVWGLGAFFAAQHDPTFLDDGRLLLLDNKSLGRHSRVIEFDALRQEIIWAYNGDEENGFFTSCCGTNQRLPNGNTLITESDGGRAFELTQQLDVVWEFFNPNHGGENGELIGRLFELRRIDPAQIASWIPDVATH